MSEQRETAADENKKCEVCWTYGVPLTRVRTTNGGLLWCEQCRSDINRKNPQVVELTATVAKLQAKLEQQVKDEADEDDAIRKAASPFLSEMRVYGNSYGVPSPSNVVQSLAAVLDATLRDKAKLQAECEQVDQDRIKTCELLEQERKSHAEAVEAAVREMNVKADSKWFIHVADAEEIIKRHLGPAQAGTGGE